MEGNVHQQGDPVVTIVMFVMLSIPLAVVAHKLAKEKGRNVALWTVLGCIPVVNYFCLAFFIGASNLKLEEKIDEFLNQQK